MLLKQMKYFVVVVECHSFTKAAEKCYISQSAISQQIRLLEEELGVSLIQREKRSFSLTLAGEYFYRHSLGIIDEIWDMSNPKGETFKLLIRRGRSNSFALYDIKDRCILRTYSISKIGEQKCQ